MFGLPEFEQWTQSEDYRQTLQLFEHSKTGYDRGWNHIQSDIYRYQWGPEDQQKVLPGLQGSID